MGVLRSPCPSLLGSWMGLHLSGPFYLLKDRKPLKKAYRNDRNPVKRALQKEQNPYEGLNKNDMTPLESWLLHIGFLLRLPN